MLKKVLLVSLAAMLSLSASSFAATATKKAAPKATATAKSTKVKPSGSIVAGMLSDAETLNPIVSENSSETDILQGLFDNLFRLDNKANLIPSLCTVVPSKKNGLISADDKTFTFKLRKGVKWHDGKPFTAADVKFTWETYLNDKVPVPSRDPFDKITKFQIVDDYTIKMTTKSVEAAFLLGWANPGIIPAHCFTGLSGQELADALGKGGKFSRAPIGTGPFKLKEWKAGSHITLEANKDYFLNGPGLEKIIFKVVPDTNTMVTQLKTGEITVAQPQAGDYDQVKNIKGLKVTKEPASIYAHMTFNFRNPILADKNVRQALAYGFPRQQFIDSFLNGIGSIGTGPISPLNWAAAEGLEKYFPFDQAKAKALLDKAGWKMDKDGFRYKNGKKLAFEICTNSGNKTREAIEATAQQYWKQLGVDLSIKNYEATTLFGDILENFKFDIILFGWVTGSDPDCYSLFHSEQIPTPANEMAGQNYAGYVNKDVDKLIVQAKTITDRDARTTLYKKIQKIVVEEMPLYYLYNYVDVHTRPANLKNYKPGPFTNGRFWNVYEWQLGK